MTSTGAHRAIRSRSEGNTAAPRPDTSSQWVLRQTDMTLTAESLTAQIERELARLNDRRVIAHIRERLVPPKTQMRPWDYGAPGEAFPCWFVFEDKPINAGIAYCESGFGPRTPWG
jgi:hypothetical protein